jgi:glutamate synthase domain-containing protein 2
VNLVRFTNNCPVGIATQKEHLRARLPVDEAAHRLNNAT